MLRIVGYVIVALVACVIEARAATQDWMWWGTNSNTIVPATTADPLPVTGTFTQAPEAFTPLGFQQITSLGSAATLTVPATAKIAVIEPNSAGTSVRWRDDGTNPTSSVGIELLPGSQLTYSGTLSAISFIQTSATATLNVSYYK